MGSFKSIGEKISADNYPKILDLVSSKQQWNYIDQNDLTSQIALGQFLHKYNSCAAQKHYSPLNFRDIVLYGYEFKKEYTHGYTQGIPGTKSVINGIEKMTEEKELKEEKRNILIRIIHIICDYIEN